MPIKISLNLNLNVSTDDLVAELNTNPTLAHLLSALVPAPTVNGHALPAPAAVPPQIAIIGDPPTPPATGHQPQAPWRAAVAEDEAAIEADRAARSQAQPEPADEEQIDSTPAPEPPAQKTTGRLPQAEFDQLVHSELHRLAKNGVMPGHAKWKAARDPRLPTLDAVLKRNLMTSLAQLGARVGLQPTPRGGIRGKKAKAAPAPTVSVSASPREPSPANVNLRADATAQFQHVAQLLDDTVAEFKRLAWGDDAPTMNRFDKEKGAHLPKFQNISRRLGMSYEDVVEEAGLALPERYGALGPKVFPPMPAALSEGVGLAKTLIAPTDAERLGAIPVYDQPSRVEITEWQTPGGSLVRSTRTSHQVR